MQTEQRQGSYVEETTHKSMHTNPQRLIRHRRHGSIKVCYLFDHLIHLLS